MNEILNIPLEKAIKICKEIREEIKKNKLSFLGHMCLGCIKFSHGDSRKMLFNKNSNNNGCYLVNARYLKDIHLFSSLK